jgi:hypothetical protein
MSINDLFECSGLSEEQFATTYAIPKKKLKKWLNGNKECPDYVIRLLSFAVPVQAYLRRIEFQSEEKDENGNKYMKDYVILYNTQIISTKEVENLIKSKTWRTYNETYEKFIITTPKAGIATLGSD